MIYKNNVRKTNGIIWKYIGKQIKEITHVGTKKTTQLYRLKNVVIYEYETTPHHCLHITNDIIFAHIFNYPYQ